MSRIEIQPPDHDVWHGRWTGDPSSSWYLRDPNLVFAGLCLIAVSVRFVLLVAPGAPSGIDGGNWLAYGHGLLGDPIKPATMTYPPVVPVLVTGLVAMMGVTAGVAAAAVLTGLAPAAASYVLLRAAGLRLFAALLAGGLAVSASTGEGAAWGGYPQLLGTGLSVVWLWRLDLFLRSRRPRHALVAGVALAFVLATSHLAASLALGAGLILGAFQVSKTGVDSVPRLVRGLAFVVLPSLPLVPLYLKLVAILPGFESRSDAVRLHADTLLSSLRLVFRDWGPLWWAASAVAVVTPLVLHRKRRESLWLIEVSLLCSAAALAALAREPRFLHVLPLVVVLALGMAIGVWEPARFPAKRAVGVALGVTVMATAVAGLGTFPRQRDSHRVLTPGLLDGISWIRERTAPDALVAVSPVRDLPVGWWIEGVARRRTLPGAALRWLYFEDERRRAIVANRIFHAGWEKRFPDDASLDAAASAGAQYVFVAKEWAGYSPEAMERLRSRNPEQIAFANDAVVIIRIDKQGTPASVP